MHKKILQTLTILFLSLSLDLVLAQPSTTSILIIANGLDVPICYVHFSLSSETSWGQDRLGSSEVIQPGEERHWKIDTGTYDVQVLDCSSEILAEIYGIDVTSVYRWDVVMAGNGESANQADELNSLGIQAYSQGDFAEALSYFTQALGIYQISGDLTGEGTTRNNIGGTYAAQGQFAVALDFYFQALAIRQEIDDRNGQRVTLNNIGAAYSKLGDYELAVDYHEQALTIARELYDRAGEGQVLGNLGVLYRYQGRYVSAIEMYEEALDISREYGDRTSEATTLNNLGTVYRYQGQYNQALDYHNQALIIAQDLGDRATEGAVLANLCATYQVQGQSAQAFNSCFDALVILREIGNHATEAQILDNIGSVYASQERYIEALDFYGHALSLANETGDRAVQATILDAIGVIYSVQNQYDQALEYYNESRNILNDIGDIVGEGVVLLNIGAIYEGREDYEQALTYYQQALDVALQTGARRNEGVIRSNLGVVYFKEQRYTDALAQLEQSLDIRREVADRLGEARTLSNLGFLFEVGFNDARHAITYYQQAIEIQESLLQTASVDTAIVSLVERSESTNLYTRLVALLIGQNELSLALEYSERGRSVLIRDELRNNQIDFRANLQDEDLLREEQRLRLAMIDTLNLVNALAQDLSASSEARQNAAAELLTARQNYERHIEQMQLRGGYLVRELALDVATLADIQAVLPQDTTLLLYGVSEFDGYALLVTSEGLRGTVLNITTDQLSTLIREFGLDRMANETTLNSLYDTLFAPISDQITTPKLIVVPDGVINYVPFVALQAPDGTYLIDRFTISISPSGTVLVLLDERKPSSDALTPGLVLAQPLASGFPNLQSAVSEVESIANLLRVEPVTDATERDLRERSAASSVLHISAHAELNPITPMFSTIYLRSDDEFDGRFEVREIYELDLTQGTELAILSGCDTGSGSTGEDFGLLTRAFLVAGTPRVLASLWSVDDTATSELLTQYIRLRIESEYLSDAEVFRAAMLYTRQIYPQPNFWASFTLVGLP